MSTITPTKTAPAGNWSADPVHSNVSFEIAYAGTNTFRGGFHDYAAGLQDGVLTGSAKVASVDVKDEQLNGHLQTPDFFDAERFPEISFRVGITLEAKVDRNEFGVSWNAPNQGGGNYLGDDVTIKAELAMVKSAARQES
jgi:polyisoprenoid-binding protein YceI